MVFGAGSRWSGTPGVLLFKILPVVWGTTIARGYCAGRRHHLLAFQVGRNAHWRASDVIRHIRPIHKKEGRSVVHVRVNCAGRRYYLRTFHDVGLHHPWIASHCIRHSEIRERAVESVQDVPEVSVFREINLEEVPEVS